MRDKRFQKKLKKIEKKGKRYKAEYEVMEKYAEYYPQREGAKVSNIMLCIIVFMITAYTVANFWILYKTGNYIDSTLTTCFYAFWGTEVIGLTGIKLSKVFKGQKDKSNDDYLE